MDGKITERGYIQIDALGERFSDLRLDAVYSSDLSRAVTTTQAITRHHNIPHMKDKRLREVCMGVWEDTPWGNAEYDAPEQMYNFAFDPEKWEIEGAEKFYELKARISDIIFELAEKHEGQTIAIISHGMAIRSFICHIMDIPSERTVEIAHGDNTSVALINVEKGKALIEYYNDNSHLAKNISTFERQSWWRNAEKAQSFNLRFIPMNLKVDGKLYTDCYADAWQSSYGSLKGFSARSFLQSAEIVSQKYPFALMKTMNADEFAGIIELSPEHKLSVDSGWISFCYIRPDKRGAGFGAQLIGHCISEYRKLGRKSLRLHVAEVNERAIGFYQRLGFVHIDTEKSRLSPLWLMEKKI